MKKWIILLLSFSILEAAQLHIVINEEDLVSDEVSIEQVKQQIELALAIPAPFQRFLNGDEELDDHSPYINLADNPITVAVESTPIIHRKGKYPAPREYWAPVSQEDRQNLHFLITSLANKPIFKLIQLKSTLEKTGDKIEHIHPIQFIYEIFANDEMRVGMYNMKRRYFVWKDFMAGVSESFNNENDEENLYEDYFRDFAQKLKIDYALLLPSIQKKDWAEFVTTLIQKLPRQSQSDRYGI